MVSACVPSHFNWPLHINVFCINIVLNCSDILKNVNQDMWLVFWQYVSFDTQVLFHDLRQQVFVLNVLQ